MKIGFYVTGSATSSHHDLMNQIMRADEAGFDSVWLRERHFKQQSPTGRFYRNPIIMGQAASLGSTVSSTFPIPMKKPGAK